MKRDIRFLLTNKCNYNCFFCHNEGVEDSNTCTEMQLEDYLTLYSIYSKLEDWNGVTLSGGEPLIYKDIDVLVKELHQLGAVITIVTNGYLLKEHINILQYVDRINLSLHTLDEDTYHKIVGRQNVMNKVLTSLRITHEKYPNLKIRLNITPTKDLNWSDELLAQLIDFSKEINASLKFTELFPKTDENCIELKIIQDTIQNLGYKEKDSYNRYKHFQKNEHSILLTQCTCSKAIEYPSPIHYCRKTHDLYVNHTGDFLLCRLGDESINFLEEIENQDYDGLRNKIKLAQQKIADRSCLNRLGNFDMIKEIYNPI